MQILLCTVQLKAISGHADVLGQNGWTARIAALYRVWPHSMPHYVKTTVENPHKLGNQTTHWYNWPSDTYLYTKYFTTGLYLCCHLVTVLSVYSLAICPWPSYKLLVILLKL